MITFIDASIFKFFPVDINGAIRSIIVPVYIFNTTAYNLIRRLRFFRRKFYNYTFVLLK